MKLLAFAVLAFAAVPLRAEKPWAAPRQAVPSNAVCLSRPVAGCMDIVNSYLQANGGRVSVAMGSYSPSELGNILVHFTEAEGALQAQAARLRPIALLGETIPIRSELTQEIISVYRAALAHRRIVSWNDPVQRTQAMRNVALARGGAENFISAARQLGSR